MNLYHFEVGFPKQVVYIHGVLHLNYSRHAIAASLGDRYGVVVLPKTLDVERAKLIEIEVCGNLVIKSVYRIELDAERDLVLVVGRDGFVRTVWVNLKSDTHRSLDRRKYRIP
jgi:hypothetical protein